MEKYGEDITIDFENLENLKKKDLVILAKTIWTKLKEHEEKNEALVNGIHNVVIGLSEIKGVIPEEE